MMKYSLTHVSVDDVRFALKHLKKCKSDCTDYNSDNCFNATELLFSYVSMLFSMMLT